MKHLILLVVVVISSLSTVDAQLFDISRLKIIETFDQQFKASEPAFFTLTHPDTGKTSYQIQAAIGYSFIEKSWGSVSALYEWHQNTGLDKPQNTRQFGFSFDRIQNSQEKAFLNIRGNLKWSNDIEADKKSIVSSFLVSPYLNWKTGIGKWLNFDDIHQPQLTYPKFSNWLQYFHNITVGFDYVNFYNAASEQAQGGIGMTHFEYEAHVYPFSGFLENALDAERFIDFYYIGITRYELANKTDDKKDWRPLQKYGVAISFKTEPKDKKREIKLALERIYGEDILKGLQSQEYWQIALKVKV